MFENGFYYGHFLKKPLLTLLIVSVATLIANGHIISY